MRANHVNHANDEDLVFKALFYVMIAILLLLLTSCGGGGGGGGSNPPANPPPSGDPNPPPNPPVTGKTSVAGTVVDSQGTPVPSATVSVGQSYTHTAASGSFLLEAETGSWDLLVVSPEGYRLCLRPIVVGSESIALGLIQPESWYVLGPALPPNPGDPLPPPPDPGNPPAPPPPPDPEYQPVKITVADGWHRVEFRKKSTGILEYLGIFAQFDMQSYRAAEIHVSQVAAAGYVAVDPAKVDPPVYSEVPVSDAFRSGTDLAVRIDGTPVSSIGSWYVRLQDGRRYYLSQGVMEIDSPTKRPSVYPQGPELARVDGGWTYIRGYYDARYGVMELKLYPETGEMGVIFWAGDDYPLNTHYFSGNMALVDGMLVLDPVSEDLVDGTYLDFMGNTHEYSGAFYLYGVGEYGPYWGGYFTTGEYCGSFWDPAWHIFALHWLPEEILPEDVSCVTRNCWYPTGTDQEGIQAFDLGVQYIRVPLPEDPSGRGRLRIYFFGSVPCVAIDTIGYFHMGDEYFRSQWILPPGIRFIDTAEGRTMHLGGDWLIEYDMSR